MSGLISVNGDILEAERAFIPATDRGLLFGDNIFEVFVGFGGVILNVPEHLQRLRRSAAALYLDLPWSDEQLAFELEHMAQQMDCAKTYLRLVVTRGNGLGLDLPQPAIPNKYVYAFPARQHPEEIYREGLRLKVKNQGFTRRQASPKTGNYLDSILAIHQSRREEFDDVLWVNSSDEITEASTANIFFVGRHGESIEITTPPLQSGILSGITRQVLLALLRKAGIEVEEAVISPYEIPRFDEAFVCSTVRGIVPICQIDGHVLPTVRPTAVFHHIAKLYMTWVEAQVGYPVDWNSGEKFTPQA